MMVRLPRLRLYFAFVAAAYVCMQGTIAPAGALQDAQAQQPSFRTGATIVEVDVIVRDNRRQFVTGLTAADFEILEDGKPQRIQTLYVVEGTRVEPLPVAGAAEPSVPTAAAPATPRLPAAQRVFVLMFDQVHLDQNSFKRAQEAAEKFLNTDFQQGDVGGVLMGTTMVGNRLTADRAALVAAVKSAKLSSERTSLKRDLQEWPRMSEVEAVRIALMANSAVLKQVADRANREAGESSGGRGAGFDAEALVEAKARQITSQIQASAGGTLKAINALMSGLGRIPGRKTVVLITEGFMFEDSIGALRHIVGVAARSDVRVYTLDALGLRRKDTTTDPAQMNPLETGGQIPTDSYKTVEEGPNTLAMDTGGYVIRNTNDFTGALAEISRDTSSYYVIGYSPSNADMDGSFRQISVRVKRPGVQVRARKGYLAAPGAAPAGAGSTPPRDAPAAASPAPTVPAAPKPEPTAPIPVPAPGEAKVAPTVVDPAKVPEGLATAPLVIRPDTASRVRALESMNAIATPARDIAAQGWERYRSGDLEAAERLLSEAAALAEAAPWVHYALGFAQYGLRKPGEAIASWERVRSAVPEFTEVYLDLADAYLTLDDAGRAVTVLREAEKRWPTDADVLNALGTMQVRRGALNDAVETFGRAIERQPKDSLAYFNLARTHELRYYQMRRFSRPGARWIDNPEELKKAAEYYEAYLRIGGPYEEDARAGLARVRFK